MLILLFSLCILGICLGLAQFLEVHAVQHGWTAGKKIKGVNNTALAPGVAADVNHEMPILLVGIYCVKIEEWRTLVLDWMSLSRLPGEVCAQHWL